MFYLSPIFCAFRFFFRKITSYTPLRTQDDSYAKCGSSWWSRSLIAVPYHLCLFATFKYEFPKIPPTVNLTPKLSVLAAAIWPRVINFTLYKNPPFVCSSSQGLTTTSLEHKQILLVNPLCILPLCNWVITTKYMFAFPCSVSFFCRFQHSISNSMECEHLG